MDKSLRYQARRELLQHALFLAWHAANRICAKWSVMIASLENTQARQLTELYRALRLYVDCFQPSMKLLSKQRDGKKVRCVYETAKTPLQRLLTAS